MVPLARGPFSATRPANTPNSDQIEGLIGRVGLSHREGSGLVV